MRTPSLQRRVVRTGVVVVLGLVVGLELFVFLIVRAGLEQNLNEALTLRQDLARDIAAETDDAQQLADTLARLGVPAEVLAADGTEISVSPAVLRSRPGEALPVSNVAFPRDSRPVALDDGTTVTVFASRAGTDETLRRLFLVSLGGTVASVLAAVLLLRRVSRFALEPLEHVVAAATRTAEGKAGERLRPDDPSTELGRFATAYDRMLDELETALQEARESDERSRRFLGDAAHQLRTPMTTIRAAVELLLSNPDPQQREQHLSHLVRETTRGARVVSSLLTLARLDQGRPPDLQPTDLEGLVTAELERTRSLAPHLAIVFVGEIGHEPVNIDGDLLSEAMGNILDNARRHATSRIEVTAVRDEGRLTITIEDDGPGIPEDARELIFERFATLDSKGGSGLGLPIARTIVEGHGGSLVYDDDGFRLDLPVGPQL